MKMIKKLALLLCVVMLIGVMAVTSFAAEEPNISIEADAASKLPGDTVTYTVYLNDSDKLAGGVWSYEFYMTLPEGLTYVGYEINPELTAITGFTKPTFVEKSLKGFAQGASDAGYTGGKVAIMTITCTVDADAAGDLTVTVGSIYLVDEMGGGVEPADASCTINVHVCAVAEYKEENVVPASCTAAGSYDYVGYCSCGKELSRETKTIEKLAHTKGEPVKENEVAPTCQVAGSYDLVVRCTECGDVLESKHVDGAYADHVAGEPVKENVVDATCQVAGSYDKVVYCTECGEKLESTHVDGAYGEHVAGERVKENVVDATCSAEGSYDEVVYCTVCGEEIERKTVTVDAIGHLYTYSFVPGEDFHTATCAHCGDSYTEPHTFVDGKCVCGAEYVPEFGDNTAIVMFVMFASVAALVVVGYELKRKAVK